MDKKTNKNKWFHKLAKNAQYMNTYDYCFDKYTFICYELY